MKDWEIKFSHTDTGGNNFAQVRGYTNNRCAMIDFCTDWPEDSGYPLNDDEIRKTSFHETCHLLTRKLCDIAESRHINGGEIEDADHEIVRVLENVLFPKY